MRMKESQDLPLENKKKSTLVTFEFGGNFENGFALLNILLSGFAIGFHYPVLTQVGFHPESFEVPFLRSI